MKENKLYFAITLEWIIDENKQNTLILPGKLHCKAADGWNCAGMNLNTFLNDCKYLLQKRAFGSVAEVMGTLYEAFVRLAADESFYLENLIWSPKVVANGKSAEINDLGCKFPVIKRVKAHFSEDESRIQNQVKEINPTWLAAGTLMAGMVLSGSMIGAAGGTGIGQKLLGGAAAWLAEKAGRAGKQEEKKPAGKAPAVRTSLVQFRAAAPAGLERGRYFPLKILMYEQAYRALADEMTQRVASQRMEEETGFFEMTYHNRVRIRLMSGDIDAEGEEDEVIWHGKLATFSFQLKLPQDYRGTQVRLQGRVYVNDVALTSVKLLLDVVADQPQVKSAAMDPVYSAFMSYSSLDRAAVTARIQGMQAAVPEMDIFLDVESLRRGELWQGRLFEEIQKHSVLYLFWSRNAAKSDWVEKEWRYALQIKGQQGIEPVPLEPPRIAPPPEELMCRHFDDWTLRYQRFSEAAEE